MAPCSSALAFNKSRIRARPGKSLSDEPLYIGSMDVMSPVFIGGVGGLCNAGIVSIAVTGPGGGASRETLNALSHGKGRRPHSLS
jgi:hypothetical protein